jgi:hypothetical protein
VSSLVNVSGTLRVIVSDRDAGDPWFHSSENRLLPEILVMLPDEYMLEAFRSPWWPSRSSMMAGWDGVDNVLTAEQRYAWPRVVSGCNGRLGFVGYTRDQYGSIVANCTVRCFRTSTDELVAKVTSDANGLYYATSPYSDAHYLTVHKSGTPDIAGASIDTLTPS